MTMRLAGRPFDTVATGLGYTQTAHPSRGEEE